jgi:hypothetical protein
MKTKILFFIAFSAGLVTRSQTLSPTVVASAGGFVQNSASSLSYTIGEMTMVQTFSNNGNILTQGFQQPDEKLSTMLASAPTGADLFMLYPNPAIDNVWFAFQFMESGYVSVTLMNDLGQQIALVYHGQTEGAREIQKLDVSKLAPGNYLLDLQFNGATAGKTSMQNKKFIVIR